MPGDHLLDPNAHPFPFVLHVAGNEGEGLGIGGAVAPNLSKAALRYCAALELTGNAETSRIVWHHALAIAYSPAWLAENGDGIRQGWPRVPLPDSADLLRASAEIGERVAALLDPQTAVPGVTAGRRARNSPPSPSRRPHAVLSAIGGSPPVGDRATSAASRCPGAGAPTRAPSPKPSTPLPHVRLSLVPQPAMCG